MERLDNLLLKLNEHIETHPNLINMWINYIKIKKSKVDSILEQGEKMLDNIKHINDFHLESIPFILVLLSGQHNMEQINNT